MNKLPAWIPAANSWLSAILLILLMRGLAVVIRVILQMGDSLIVVSPKLRMLLYFSALLSPILVITVAHHLLHIFLERFYPDSRSPEMTDNPGIFPSLMSWWEGFYGWMAIALALVVSYIIEILISFSEYGMLQWWEELKDLFTVTTLIRVIVAAYIYQFENLVRDHLMSVGSRTN